MNNHFTYHEKFTAEDFEAQYNLRLRRPDFEQTVLQDWLQRSETARQNLVCRLDIRYGDGPKQKFDVFECGDSGAPTLIYFHGGYWKSGDKSLYSFLALPFLAEGVNVVVAGYDLCPDITLTQISQQARQAVSAVYQQAGEYGLSSQRLSVMGHSAGGHITEMMMGTNWSEYSADLPVNLLHAAIPISPLSYLEPVRLTAGLNSGIRMDEAEAQSQSPMLNHPPATAAPQLLVVGGSETAEFHRQAQMYYNEFKTDSRSMELCVVPDVDHFDVINVLADPHSEPFAKVLKLIT